MINLIDIRRSTLVATSLFMVTALLTGCSDASEQQSSPPPYVARANWQTLCIDRFLIDLPVTIQTSETPAKYQAAYVFKGIDIGGRGPTWGAVNLIETIKTDSKGYQAVYDGARGRLASPGDYKAGFKAKEEEISYQEMQTKTGSPAKIALAKSLLADSKKELELAHFGLKVSGHAKLQEDHAFAIRIGNEYSFGYLDPVDQRVRAMAGSLSHPQLESPEAAAEEYRNFRRIYHSRSPTEIPTTPGFCTSYGFIDEVDRPNANTAMELPFRSLKYPNLIFILTIAPADQNGRKNIQKLPDMDAENAKLHLVGIKGKYGPVAENILGTPGRSFGYEYGPNCSSTSCRPADQAYEIEAETFGEPGHPQQPHLILRMIAATSDDYRLKLPAQPNEPSYNTPSRPALSGHVPPSFKEGKEIFEQVLRSIRLRPGAIAGSVVPVAPESKDVPKL